MGNDLEAGPGDASPRCACSAPYGWCPTCGAPGVNRERRPDGNDTCENGHVYASRDAVTEKKQTPPFALLVLTDLKVRKFQHKSELLDAIKTLNARGIGSVALVWNTGASVWTVPELWS